RSCPSRPSRSPSRPGALVQQGLDARDLAPHLADLHRVFHAPRGALEPQLVELLVELPLPRAQLVHTLLTKLCHLHSPTSVCSRVTKRVLMGSLWAARRNASSAISRVTPSIS